jgi:DmsE family decaheme c-type cytochrome
MRANNNKLLLLALALSAVQAAQGQAPSEASPKQAPAAAPAAPAAEAPKKKEFVGSETCGTCHEDIAKGLAKDRHHAIEFNKKFEGKACEACHGPGSVHAESLETKDIIRKNQPACNSCHTNQAARASRAQSAHHRNQVDCFSCHSMHKPAVIGTAKTREITANCSNCHTDVKAQFQKPHRHPINQPSPVMSCVDCHDPHGGPLPKMARNVHGAETNCVKCHGEVRGPFVFEHRYALKAAPPATNHMDPRIRRC